MISKSFFPGLAIPANQMSEQQRASLKRRLTSGPRKRSRKPPTAGPQNRGAAAKANYLERLAQSKQARAAQHAPPAPKPAAVVRSAAPQRSSFTSARQAGAIGATGAGAGAAALTLKRRDERRKRGEDLNPAVDAAIGSAGGAAAAHGADNAASLGVKRTAQRFRNSRMTPEAKQAWRRFQEREGFRSIGSRHSTDKVDMTDSATRSKVLSRYPKEIPGWRAQRYLAFTENPKYVAGITAAGALAGGAAMYHRAKEKNRVNKAMSDAQLARRKKRQAAYSTTTATLGLAALGTKGGSAVAARMPRYAQHAGRLDRTATTLTTTAAGVGGVGGYNFAAVEREEARRRRKGESTFGKADEMSTPEFGAWYDRSDVSKSGPYDSEEKRHQRLGAAAGAGAVASGVVGYKGAKEVKRGVQAERKAASGLRRAGKVDVSPKGYVPAAQRTALSGVKGDLKSINAARKLQGKGAAILGLAALGAAGSAGIARHANNRGKTYRAWYDD